MMSKMKVNHFPSAVSFAERMPEIVLKKISQENRDEKIIARVRDATKQTKKIRFEYVKYFFINKLLK